MCFGGAEKIRIRGLLTDADPSAADFLFECAFRKILLRECRHGLSIRIWDDTSEDRIQTVQVSTVQIP